MKYGVDGPIVIWAWGKYYQLANAAVNIYNTNIDSSILFTVVEKTSTEIYDYLEDHVDINDLPNIILVDDIDIKRFLNLFPTLFSGLNNYIDTEKYFRSKITHVSHWSGGIYGYPISCEPCALYYNKSIFSDNGIDMPENLTWLDMIYIGQQLSSSGIYLLPHFSSFLRILIQSTGELFYNDSEVISSGEALAEMTLIRYLNHNDCLYPTSLNLTELSTALSDGEIACVIRTPDLFDCIQDLENWGVVPLPKNDTFLYDVDYGGKSWMVIDKGSVSDKEYVYDFLMSIFGLSNDNDYGLSELLAGTYGLVPPTYYALENLSEEDPSYYLHNNIVFLLGLMSDIPETYFGLFTNDLLSSLSGYIDDLLTDEDYSIADALSGFEDVCGYYSEEEMGDPLELESILITCPPDKTVYFKYETFDPTGMVVLATFSDGSHFSMTSGFNYSTSPLQLNQSSITITYASGGVTATGVQNITVMNRTLTSLNVRTRGVYLHGSYLNTNDFRVEAEYNMGDSRYVYDFSISPTFLDTVGPKTIAITYTEDISVVETINIQVERKLIDIHVYNRPSKLMYVNGERFNANGLQLQALYSDGTNGIVKSGNVKTNLVNSIVRFDNGVDRHTITLSYSEHSVYKTVPFTVYRRTGFDIDETEITQDMDKCGKGSISLSSGELTYAFNDYSGTDGNMPISISRTYKESFDDNSCYGANWRLNIQQEIKSVNGVWEFTDKEGEKYLFDEDYSTNNNRSSIRCEKLGYDLFYDETNHIIEIIDRENNTYVFSLINYVYRLIEVHKFPSTYTNPINAYSLEIVYLYDGKISLVRGGKPYNGNRPTINFIYENGLLSSLKYNYTVETTVVTYSYSQGKLTNISKCNNRINGNYLEVTSFNYPTSLDNSFTVIDTTSKDANNNYRHLRYYLDSENRVSSFVKGYSSSDEDTTELYYTTNTIPSETTTDIVLSTYTICRDTVSVVNFSTMGVVSQYEFERSSETNPYYKPTKIYGAQSRGFDYLSIADTYSDTLDVFHDEFENGSTCNWNNATNNLDRCVYGNGSIYGTNLTKTYTLSSEEISNNTTIYLSLWVYAPLTSDTEIKVIILDADNQGSYFTHILGKNLDMWQYTSFSLGKRKIGDRITIEIKNSSEVVYVDDVRFTKSPYETPDNIGDSKFDDFDKPTKTYSYNHINGTIKSTEYTYNSGHQLLTQIEKEGSTVTNKTVNSYTNGLVDSKKVYGKSSHYNEQSFVYNNDGTLSSMNDENNITVNYTYGGDWAQSSVVGEVDSPTTTLKNTLYQDSDTLKEISSSNLKNEYTYTTDGSLLKAKYGYSNNQYDSNIDFVYDSFGNLSEVKIGSISLITLSYDSKHLNSITHANGDVFSYTYDNKDRLISTSENGTTSINISYSDTNDNILIISHANGIVYRNDAINKNGTTSSYEVKDNNITKLKVVGKASNGLGNISTIEYYIEDSVSPFEKNITTKDSNGQVVSIQRENHGGQESFSYDSSYRLSSRETTYQSGNNQKKIEVKYNYTPLSGYRTGTSISSEKLQIDNLDKDNYSYEYYVNGNIKGIYNGDTLLSKYVYDEFDRLIWEYNYALYVAYQFSYDGSGNILEKKSYHISNGIVDVAPFNTETFDYSTITPNAGQNSAWKDQLKSFNNTPISYDASSNPTTYMGNTLVWSGRKLKQFNNIQLDYDYNGLRVKKGDKSFYWVGGDLISERWGNNYIYYYYDINGVCGFNYNGTEYYYRKNILGDILAIYDKNGVLKCSYVYDGWGNHKVYDENGIELLPASLNIGNINPFRYRSYYWDKEFNLYYLQTRYYDPTICRFISADSISYLNPEEIMGLNLYCYCANNPIMNTDPEGKFVLSTAMLVGLIIGAIVGTAIGVGVVAYQDFVDDGEIFNGSKQWYDYLGGALIGGASGAIIGATAGYFLPMVSSFMGTAFSFSVPSLTMNGGLLAVSSINVTITAGQAVAGAIGLGILCFSKGRPRNNRKQNSQMRDAFREIGRDPKDDKTKDIINKIESNIRRKHLNLGYGDLIKYILEKLEEWGM